MRRWYTDRMSIPVQVRPRRMSTPQRWHDRSGGALQRAVQRVAQRKLAPLRRREKPSPNPHIRVLAARETAVAISLLDNYDSRASTASQAPPCAGAPAPRTERTTQKVGP